MLLDGETIDDDGLANEICVFLIILLYMLLVFSVLLLLFSTYSLYLVGMVVGDNLRYELIEAYLFFVGFFII